MPAKYSHHYTYEQMTNTGRHAYKDSTPLPPRRPEPKKWFVLGVEVDYNTYREYTFRKTWTIDGDVLKGFDYPLYLLERYATDEYTKEDTLLATNARKILDQIREEITSRKNEEITSRKDSKNMKDLKTAVDYIEALNDIYKESRESYATLQDKVDKAKAKMDRAYEDLCGAPTKEKPAAQCYYDIARGEYGLAEGARRSEHLDMVSNHEKRVAELRKQFADYLDDHYNASPDKLDEATMQLLNSGICTPSELARLSDRQKENPVMLRIIGSYASKLCKDNKRNMSDEDQFICRQVARTGAVAKNGARELSIFDSAAETANYGLDKDAAHAGRMHTFVANAFESYKNQMGGITNTSAENI